ncbi:MAG: hypothetical protein II601_01405, partial [Lachnospiraceae bacterium]|nr:hypothetical protein [Lachnospiraceae bacterium]
MRKNLLEVFPGLPAAKLVTMDLLQTTEVERLAYSEDRRTVNAFLVFHRLVDKAVILSLEKALNEQFFNGGDTGLRIRESYELSDYSLSDIVSLYRDSAVMDLTREYPAFSSILRRSHWEVRPDGRLGIQFSGNGFAKNYAKDWAGYIEKRFLQRFGIQVSPVMEFTEKAAREETEADLHEPEAPNEEPLSASDTFFSENG